MDSEAGTLNRNPRQSTAPMATASPDVVTAIKDAVDIVGLMGEYLRVEPAGSKFRALCPFHDDKKPSLQIDPEFQNYRCWACGAKGDVFTFLQEYEKISFAEAKERLARRAGIVISSGRSANEGSKGRVLAVLDWAAKQFQNCLKDSRLGLQARQYLTDRGITDETIERHGLGFAPPEFEWLIRQAASAGFDAKTMIQAGLAKVSQRGANYDFFRARIIFPVRDVQGRTIAFGGRIVPSLDDGRAPKYLNSPTTDVYNKSRVLYGLDITAAALKSRLPASPGGTRPGGFTSSPVVVMEGYMDCLMAYQAGLSTAVATCGTALTAEHVQRLRGYSDRIVLMFDGDGAGQKAAREATLLFLGSEVDLRLCVLPEGLDPCDFVVQRGVHELLQRMADAPDALDYAIERALADYASTGLAGRSRALDEVLNTLASLPQVLRGQQQQRLDLALSRLAEVFRVEEPTLRARLLELRREAGRVRQGNIDAEELGFDRPMPPRERTIAELAVTRPERAGTLAAFVAPDSFTHPALRRIVTTAYHASIELGSAATVDHVRERLDDARLDGIVLGLVESSPKDEAYETAFRDVLGSLEEDRRRRESIEKVRVGPSADADEHLAALRAMVSTNAS